MDKDDDDIDVDDLDKEDRKVDDGSDSQTGVKMSKKDASNLKLSCIYFVRQADPIVIKLKIENTPVDISIG